MYHPPDDRDELQWVELLNTGDKPIDLAGWSFIKGLQFRFTNSNILPPKEFIVICRDRGAFVIHYGPKATVVGEFAGRLSHGGERIELADSSGKSVDAVDFDDIPPWPLSPDGTSASLERIVPDGPSDSPDNWAPSPLPVHKASGGSPGQPNHAFATNLPPIVRDVRIDSPSSGHPITVTLNAADPDGIEAVTLHFRRLSLDGTSSRRASGGAENQKPIETILAMTRSTGDATRGAYTASVPPQPEGQLLRLYVNAVDRQGSRRTVPHPNERRPTWSIYVGTITNTAAVPFAFLVQHGAPEPPGQSIRNMDWSGRRARQPVRSTEPARGDATFVYMAPHSPEARVFDHIRITPRQAGWKVRLHNDQLLDGMSTVNVLFEYQPRFVLAEHLSFEVFRAAGVPTPLSGHWRAWYNGRPVGYHLFVEQPNSTFLRRVGRDSDGDLFKLIWYGGDLIGQHEKKNNPETGHGQLVETVEQLNKTRGADQWRAIESRFNVAGFINYYAVNMVTQNWDGFFNNYFLYRAPGADGKWEIIPWDEDKTWGDYDGASPQYDWYTMPLSYGMSGAQPRMKLTERFFGGGGPHGGQSWWRNPGWFSGPLLANPEFRTRFKARLREILENEFTPEKMEGAIGRMERSLEPEIRYRATVVGGAQDGGPPKGLGFGEVQDDDAVPNPSTAAALERFRRHMDSFRRQVKNRREFLLRELDQER